MRQRWLAVVLLVCLGFSASARAEVATIDPSKQPDSTLEPAEVGKLAALQGAVFPSLVSDVSPDDAAVLTLVRRSGYVRLAFVNVQDGAGTPVGERASRFPPTTEVRWRDAHTAVYVSQRPGSTPFLVSLNRDTGDVVTSTLRLPHFGQKGLGGK